MTSDKEDLEGRTGMMKNLIRVWAGLVVIGWISAACGATLLLKDGTIIEGRIIAETSTTIRVRTPFDTRLVNRKDIDKIFLADSDDEASMSSSSFSELPEKLQALINARADYRLGNYRAVIDRIEPFAQKETNPVLKSEYLWLLIESYERFARWDEVKKMCEERLQNGTPQDKIRAQAHLDILKANADWDYSLRLVKAPGSEKPEWARNFLPAAMRSAAQDPNALADVEIMRKALDEYCSQMVRNEKAGASTLRDRLDPRKTLEAVRKFPPGLRSIDVLERMPYYEELKKAETTIYKAQAIQPGYADAFILDLIRAEGDHLLQVMEPLFAEAVATSPYNLNLPKTLDAASRQQWREACDRWLASTESLETLGEYFLNKLSAYPKEQRLIYEVIKDLHERLKEMRESVRRQRNR